MKRFALVVCVVVAVTAYAEVTPNGLVILLTDYGADSFYVGSLKGAIYKKFPEARIDAITNSVPKFDIATGAHMLMEAAQEFPVGTVFCCVVDPGVGSERKCIAIETDMGHLLVGPDNGLLSLVAEAYGLREIRQCTNQDLWREGKLTHTFHGRDIFGPVAACLAKGVPLADVGERLESLTKVDLGKSTIEGNTVRGVVTRIDGYGNVITNITYEDLLKLRCDDGDVVNVAIGQASFEAPLVRRYSSVDEGARLGLIQSLGYLEFAINMGSLAEAVDASVGAPVIVTTKQ
ncbi:MAG TPA: hypothetical protein ENN80_07305 [Candidatus Hydrogenedentes bacterium]|nr:hypothetical protein [Candidatus Hydrogenedentota bacterium]